MEARYNEVLGTGYFVCCVGHFVVSVVSEQSKQGGLIRWGRRGWFFVSDTLLYQISLYRVSTVLYFYYTCFAYKCGRVLTVLIYISLTWSDG